MVKRKISYIFLSLCPPPPNGRIPLMNLDGNKYHCGVYLTNPFQSTVCKYVCSLYSWRLRWNRVVYNIGTSIVYGALFTHVESKSEKEAEYFFFLLFLYQMAPGMRIMCFNFFISTFFSYSLVSFCLRMRASSSFSHIHASVQWWQVCRASPSSSSIFNCRLNSIFYLVCTFFWYFFLPFTGRFFLSRRFSFSNHKLRRLPYDIFTRGRRERSYRQWNVCVLLTKLIPYLEALDICSQKIRQEWANNLLSTPVDTTASVFPRVCCTSDL